MNSPKPTSEMITFYANRTNAHIERVRRCLWLISESTDHKDELMIRAAEHDASKFGPEEYIPYVWLTEYYRCLKIGEPFEYPAGIKAQVHAAIKHHVNTNRHHAEFHANPNDMTDVDLIEMVCDWTAMAQENNEPNGSALSWADKTIGTRLLLNAKRSAFIYAMINLLDQKIQEKEGAPAI